MLVACRLAGLSALKAHYVGIAAVTQSAALLTVASRMARRSTGMAQDGEDAVSRTGQPPRTGKPPRAS
jgi:hypothetical protein